MTLEVVRQAVADHVGGVVKPKKSREHEGAIAVLKAEIQRCESAGEYVDRSKSESYTRAVQLLLADREQANGHPAKQVQENGQ